MGQINEERKMITFFCEKYEKVMEYRFSSEVYRGKTKLLIYQSFVIDFFEVYEKNKDFYDLNLNVITKDFL